MKSQENVLIGSENLDYDDFFIKNIDNSITGKELSF